jgi:tripartite-type tricarboxylate transporter receptor subunit TctC
LRISEDWLRNIARFGVFAPGTTPPALVARLNALLHQAVTDAESRDKLSVQGVTPNHLSADEFRPTAASEIERWRLVIEKLRIKARP